MNQSQRDYLFVVALRLHKWRLAHSDCAVQGRVGVDANDQNLLQKGRPFILRHIFGNWLLGVGGGPKRVLTGTKETFQENVAS